MSIIIDTFHSECSKLGRFAMLLACTAEQAKLGEVYRALHAQKKIIGFGLKDVKSSVILKTLKPEDLGAPLSCLLRNSLRCAGWVMLDQEQHLSCNYLEAPPGKVRECFYVKGLSILAEFPGNVLMVFDCGKASYALMSLFRTKRLTSSNPEVEAGHETCGGS